MNITDIAYPEILLNSDDFKSDARPDTITLEFPVEPLAVQSVRRGKFGFYSPPKVKAWKAAVAELAKEQFKWDPFDGPIEVSFIQYRFPYPKTLKKAIKQKIADGITFYMDRHCDLMDNLNKATMDSLAGIIFVDDCRIVRCGGLEKIYSESPGITITFKNLKGRVEVLPR